MSELLAAHPRRTRTIKTLVTGALVGMLILGGGVSSATAAEADLADSALEQFRANLTSSADIAAFDALTAAQQTELSAYLLGETDPLAELSDSSARSGDFELRKSTTTTLTQPKATASATAAAATRTVSAWQSFLFAGITISKTTVRETYYYSGANATRIASYSCVVDANYDPFSTVTSSKSGAWVSSGRATAECRVTVKRGVPTPWGQVSWSTASNIQYVAGNGSGSVTSHGWR
ncbi:MAG: hypothetical protein QM630_00990 [Microbacterium sp.]